MKHASLQKCIAVALALAVWQGAAMAVGMDLLLPSPWQVAGGCGRSGRSRTFSLRWPSVCCASAAASAWAWFWGCCWRWRRDGCGCWRYCCGPMSR